MLVSGCVKHLHINGKLVDFLQAATTRHKVSPGCSSMQDEALAGQEEPNPCDRDPCRHGTCSVKNSKHPGFVCKCSEGYTGELCDIRGRSSC
jgi:hypothetical protein